MSLFAFAFRPREGRAEALMAQTPLSSLMCTGLGERGNLCGHSVFESLTLDVATACIRSIMEGTHQSIDLPAAHRMKANLPSSPSITHSEVYLSAAE
jgi:hypothetical protein